MIEIGEYVRTEYGYILKNTWNENSDVVEKLANRDSHYEFEYGEIVKHSKNIKDLIEVGDIVVLKEDNRKYEILSIEKATNKNEIRVCIFKSPNNCELYTTLTKDKIKTILTHEQYENNCYRVEE